MALYRVNEAKGSLSGIPETHLSSEGKQERGDLQHWLRDHPDVLEPGLFVLADGYSNWHESNREIDILGIDQGGRLIVVELKRDEGPFMDLQALRYASLVARMTLPQAVDAHKQYLKKRGIEGDARSRVVEHLSGEAGEEPQLDSDRPRIILAARDFGQELTTSALWLNAAGLDIRCVRLLPYRSGKSLLLDVTQVIPLPEARDYTVRLRDRDSEQERHDSPNVAWTQADIGRLAQQLSHPIIFAILDACAAAPDTWVTWHEARSGIDEKEPKHQLRALTRRTRKHFGRSNWPMEYKWPGYPDGDTRIFRMPAIVAEWWKAARSAASTDEPGSQE